MELNGSSAFVTGGASGLGEATVQHLAERGMKVVIAELVRRFEIRATTDRPEVARRRNITIRPGDGARVALGAREREAVAA